MNDGSFVFPTLAAGTYTISVPGSFVESGDSVTVLDDQPLSGANVALGPGGNISGQVVQKGSGQPIADMPVDLLEPDGSSISTTADSNGSYEFSGLGAGTYTVYLPLGGAETSQSVTVAQVDGTTLTANLELAYSATLGGTLVDGSGTPIADGTVELYLSGQPIASATTDATGSYQFEIVTPGTFDLLATSPEATFPLASAIEVAPGSAVTQNFQAGTGTLAVTLSDGSQPVSGDTVGLEALVDGSETILAQATVGDSGTASFADLAAGAYTVVVSGTDGDAGQATVTIAAGASAQVAISLSPQAAVSGTITDSSGNPIAGADVVLQSTGDLEQGPGYVAYTAADGTYSLQGVAPGTYDVTAFADGYEAVTQAAIAVSGAATVNAALPICTTTVSGNLVDTSGNSVPTGEVPITDSAGHVLGTSSVNPDGTFEVTSVQGNNLSLQIYAQGYSVPSVASFDAPTGASVSLPPILLTPVAVDSGSSGSTPVLSQIPVNAMIDDSTQQIGEASVQTSGTPKNPLEITWSFARNLSDCAQVFHQHGYKFEWVQIETAGPNPWHVYPEPAYLLQRPPQPLIQTVPYVDNNAGPFYTMVEGGSNDTPNAFAENGSSAITFDTFLVSGRRHTSKSI